MIGFDHDDETNGLVSFVAVIAALPSDVCLSSAFDGLENKPYSGLMKAPWWMVLCSATEGLSHRH